MRALPSNPGNAGIISRQPGKASICGSHSRRPTGNARPRTSTPALPVFLFEGDAMGVGDVLDIFH